MRNILNFCGWELFAMIGLIIFMTITIIGSIVIGHHPDADFNKEIKIMVGE